MEPRPQRPSRATGPYISTGTPNPPGAGSAGTGAFDASSAPPAPPPAIGYDPDYSPGQPLTPLKGPRGANIVGPLLAVAALAIIVAAVAFIVSQFRDGGDDNGSQPTAVVALDASPTADAGDEGEGAAADPTEEGASDDGDSSTEQADDQVANPTDAPDEPRATEVAGDEGDTAGEEETVSGDEDPDERTRARQWLPTTGDIGEGFRQSENGTRSEEDVVNSFGEGSDAAERLAEFGWLENAFRNFDRDDGGAGDTTNVTVSVHRFKSEAGAKDAMPYFAEGSGMATVEDGPELGEESISVQAALEGGNAFVIYIRQNEFVIRISGFSVSGDPAEFTTEVADRILGG